MDTHGCEKQEGVPQNLREQLALALRSIQWSYGIVWSISSKAPGVLRWVDGYYNGEIKTRKTVQTAEVNADEIGIQRSEQLKELYESLLAGEASPQAWRPSAALSPEDLTEAEWYYLVCMSFTFNIGQGLPGKALSKNQTIWLCNAHQADSKTFSRSLLAKSASIQTVVCFPCLGGVVELGATELILEDLNLIERVKASFLEIPYPTAANITSCISEDARNEQDINAAKFGHDMTNTDVNPLVEGEVIICSPNNSSNGYGADQQAEDPYIIEDIIREPSEVQSWYLMDDEMSNRVNHSVNSSDSISQSFATPQKISRLSNGGKSLNDAQHDIQESNPKDMSYFNPQGQDVHYQSVLSNLLKSSHQLILGPYFRNDRRDSNSSFLSWKKASSSFQVPRGGTPQRLLKKVLLEVAKMHNGYLAEPDKDNCRSKSIQQQEVNGTYKNHLFSEGRLCERINERFMTLSSVVPTNSKADKLSILDDTIEYLKQLERRVQELESCRERVKETRTPRDAIERTSDNYGTTKRGTGKKPQLKKRKACDIDDTEPCNKKCLLKDCSTDDVAVNIIGDEVQIEMRLRWRDGALLEILEVMSNLHLDSDAVQSKSSEGILCVTIKSKVKGSNVSSAGTIRKALQGIIKKS